jgi:hypothetical protein
MNWLFTIMEGFNLGTPMGHVEGGENKYGHPQGVSPPENIPNAVPGGCTHIAQN